MPDTSGADRASPRIDAVLVLAAGAGTRMHSAQPKVMHTIAGRPLLWHAITAAAGLRPHRLVAVIGHGRDVVGPYLSANMPHVVQAVQDQQLGTGHAVACGLSLLGDVSGTIVVTYGDVPLLSTATLSELVREHTRAENAVTVLTAFVEDPTGYGRIVRNGTGALTGIIEQKDADESIRATREINSGVYAFDATVLGDALARLGDANAQGERYLTDVVALLWADGHNVGTSTSDDPAETEGVNDRVQLANLGRRLNAHLVRTAQLAGVTVTDPATTWIDVDVAIGPDTHLLSGTSLEAGTRVGTGCVIGPDTTLIACRVADGATVLRSHCIGAAIGAGAMVGPYSYLRPETSLGEAAKVGAFVEVKKSTVGRMSKVPHLSYIGDTRIGEASNIGAGTITANYDGVTKSATVVGDNVFIGSDSTLVAPVTVGDGAYIGAGSTVTDDVQPGDLAIARGRQEAVKGWVLRRREGTASDRSARSAGATDPSRSNRPALPASTASEQDHTA